MSQGLCRDGATTGREFLEEDIRGSQEEENYQSNIGRDNKESISPRRTVRRNDGQVNVKAVPPQTPLTDLT